MIRTAQKVCVIPRLRSAPFQSKTVMAAYAHRMAASRPLVAKKHCALRVRFVIPLGNAWTTVVSKVFHVPKSSGVQQKPACVVRVHATIMETVKRARDAIHLKPVYLMGAAAMAIAPVNLCAESVHRSECH